MSGKNENSSSKAATVALALAFAVAALVAYYAPAMGGIELLGGGGLVGIAIGRLLPAGACLLGLSGLAGVAFIKPRASGIGRALLTSAYLLVAVAIVGWLALVGSMPTRPVREDWAFGLLMVIIVCLLVGIFEEGVFRGFLLGALLKVWGGTRAGVVAAIVASALVFGFVHVLPYFVYGYITSFITLAQAICKTLQAAAVGILLAVVLLESRNFWAAVAVHAANDFFAMLTDALLEGSTEITYVVSDASQGAMVLEVYIAALLIMSVPILVVSVMHIRRMPVPDYGFFDVDDESV